VIFLGAVAGAERILPLLDVFALSSDTEQMPLALLEQCGGLRSPASMSGREGDAAARKPASYRAARRGSSLTRPSPNCSATMGCADLSAG